MNPVIEEISKIGIVPVIALDDAKDAEPLAKALCEGGLPCAEVTFRTAAAEDSIRIMAEKFPEMLVGAGTVLTTEQVDKAVAAGAKFIVSPGLNPKVVSYCVSKNIPITPDSIAHTSDIPVWWRCEKGHSWCTQVRSRSRSSTGCPVCREEKLEEKRLKNKKSKEEIITADSIEELMKKIIACVVIAVMIVVFICFYDKIQKRR